MVECIVYDSLLAVYSEASSLSLAIARRHIVLNTAVVEIYDVDVA